MEAKYQQALDAFQLHKTKAAAATALGISESTFRDRLRAAQRMQGDDAAPAEMPLPRSAAIELDSPNLPESFSKIWTPYLLDGRRIGVLSDIHVPYHCPTSVAASVKYLREWNCDTLLINGDGMDFYQVSRYSRDPTKERLKRELEVGREFSAYLRGQFPHAKIIWKLGNHEERWFAYLLERAPDLFEICSNIWQDAIGGKEYGIEFVGEQRIIYVGGQGGLAILHGHELVRGTSTPVNPARTLFMRLMESAMCGHFHRASEHPGTTLSGKTIACYSTGHLCYERPEYARINQWSKGFATIEVGGVKDWRVTLKKIIDGRVY